MTAHGSSPPLETAGARSGAPPSLAILPAFVLSVGFDLLLHAGLLARLYVEPTPFLLAPEDAFRRIPLGYLAFLVLTAALCWLMRRLGVRDARAGLRLGAGAGATVWGAFAVGLYSISTSPLALLLGWWIGQALELGLAGAVLGAAAGGTPVRTLWKRVLVAVVICIAATVALQATGLAPAMKTV